MLNDLKLPCAGGLNDLTFPEDGLGEFIPLRLSMLGGGVYVLPGISRGLRGAPEPPSLLSVGGLLILRSDVGGLV